MSATRTPPHEAVRHGRHVRRHACLSTRLLGLRQRAQHEAGATVLRVVLRPADRAEGQEALSIMSAEQNVRMSSFKISSTTANYAAFGGFDGL